MSGALNGFPVGGSPISPPLSVPVAVTVHTARIPKHQELLSVVAQIRKGRKEGSKGALNGHAADMTSSDRTVHYAVLRVVASESRGIMACVTVLVTREDDSDFFRCRCRFRRNDFDTRSIVASAT